MNEYWRNVASEANKRTLLSLGLGSRRKIVISGLIALAIILALVLWGSDDASRDEMIARLTGVAIIFLLFPLLFVWNFVILPPELDRLGATKIAMLEKRLEPKLSLYFSQDSPLCYHLTYRHNHKDDEAMYVAVVPRALGKTPIKNCRGFLNAVWLLSKEGVWEPTSFVNRLPLEWSAVGWSAVEIDDVTNQALNVFYVAKKDPKIHPLTDQLLSKDHELFHDKKNRDFRFDVVVKGDNVPSERMSLTVHLGDEWDDIKVCVLGNDS